MFGPYALMGAAIARKQSVSCPVTVPVKTPQTGSALTVSILIPHQVSVSRALPNNVHSCQVC